MGCLQSRPQEDGENRELHDKPLVEWSAMEVEEMLRSRPALEQYALTALKGTVGSVLASVTDDVLKEAGVVNGLHRMQILHLRDDILKRDAEMAGSENHHQQTVAPEALSVYSCDKRTTSSLSKGMLSGVSSMDQALLDGRKRTESVDMEKGRYMAMMKILPSGNLIRVVGETLPLQANCIASHIVQLHKLHCLALYNIDNCRRFVKRCCQIQGLFASKRLHEYINNIAIIQRIEEVLKEALHFFENFSQRGWLKRVLQSPPDRHTFQELDHRLIESCLMSRYLKVSESSAINLQQSPIYKNSTKHLSRALLEIGGMEALRQSQAAFEKILPHFPESRHANLDDRIQEEVQEYELDIDCHGAHSVVRHHHLQLFWKLHFSQKDQVPWEEFWQCFLHYLKKEQQLSLTELLKNSQNRDVVQVYLTRALPQMLSVVEIDFLFEPKQGMEEILQKLLSVHLQLTSIRTMSESCISLIEGPIKDGMTFNMPALRGDLMERKELLIQVVLGVQDKGTKIIQFTGSPGIGKSTFANQTGRYLLSMAYWTEAYWIDLSGIATHTAAGYQTMHGMGILCESTDLSFLFGYLQRHQGSIGLIFVGLDSLVKCRDDESRFLDFLESIANSSDQVQIVLVTHKELKETRACMVRYTIEPCDHTQCKTWMQEQLKQNNPDNSAIEKLLDNISHPLCLDLLRASIRMGESNPEELTEMMEGSLLSTLVEEITTEPLTTLEPKAQRCLLACLMALDVSLLQLVCALALVPCPFTEDFAVALLQKNGMNSAAVQFSLRQLENRGILCYNKGLDKYSLHVLIRSAGHLLSGHLGLDHKEVIKNYVEVVHQKIMKKAEQVMKQSHQTTAALHVLHRNEAHIYQLMQWASQPFANECLSVFKETVWEAFACLAYRLDPNSLEKFYDACLHMADEADDQEFKVHCLIQNGEMLRAVDRLQDSENTFRDALVACFSISEAQTLETARCYEGIGWCCMKLKKIVESVENYKKAIAIYEVVMGKNALEVARCSSAMGKACSMGRKHEEAHQSYLRALELYKEMYGSEHVLIARSLVDLGTQLKLMNKERESEQHFRDALEMFERVLGTDHPEVASVLMDFSAVLRQMKKQSSAEANLLKALQIREYCYGIFHSETQNCVQSLATLYKAMHRFEEAIRYASRDVELCKRLFGPTEHQVTTAAMTLATILCDAGNYTNAHLHCKRALSVREKQQGTLHLSVAQSCHLMGIILRHLGKYKEAKTATERCLNIRQTKIGDKPHPDIAASLNGLAAIENDLQEFNKAEEHCRRGLEIRKQLFKEDHLSVGLSFQTLATIHASSNNLAEAESCIRQSIRIREKHFKSDTYPLMQSYDVLADILCKSNQLEEAEEKAHIAVDVKTKSLGNEHPEVGRSLMVLGTVLLAQSNFSAARQKLHRAINIFTLAFGEEHPSLDIATAHLNKCSH